MRETPFEFQGKKYRRMDLGVNGSVQGFLVPKGTRARYFVDRPEFVFEQWGQTGALPATARYYARGGVGITLLVPESSQDWNGKLYMHVHGAGTCVGGGDGYPSVDAAAPTADLSVYNDLMLAKGYAVAATGPATTNSARLDTIPSGGSACTEVTTADGAVRRGLNLTDHAEFHVQLVKLAKNVVRARMGRRPSRTYWYGHSSGARVNRLINYIPELNTDEIGAKLIDGFLGDDPAAGQWLPVRYEHQKDVLFATEPQKRQFTHQIDVAHHLYDDVKGDPVPAWVSNVTIINKRTSAKIFRDKGLASRYRMYEVRGVSHDGGDSKRPPQPGVQTLKLAPLMDSLIDALEAWVEKGTEPPPTKSDWHELGDSDKDGKTENAALRLPNVACPLGVFHTYPANPNKPTPFVVTHSQPSALRPNPGEGTGQTGFAEYDDNKVEPVDGRGVFVDMNRNGYHDQRESVSQAWRRLGLLGEAESFTWDKYAQCVRSASSTLRRQGFLSADAERTFNEEATKASSQAAWAR